MYSPGKALVVYEIRRLWEGKGEGRGDERRQHTGKGDAKSTFRVCLVGARERGSPGLSDRTIANHHAFDGLHLAASTARGRGKPNRRNRHGGWGEHTKCFRVHDSNSVRAMVACLGGGGARSVRRFPAARC